MASTDLVPAAQTTSTDVVHTEPVRWPAATVVLRFVALAALVVALALAGAVAFMVAQQ